MHALNENHHDWGHARKNWYLSATSDRDTTSFTSGHRLLLSDLFGHSNAGGVSQQSDLFVAK